MKKSGGKVLAAIFSPEESPSGKFRVLVDTRLGCSKNMRKSAKTVVDEIIRTGCIDRIPDCRGGRLVVRADCNSRGQAERFENQVRKTMSLFRKIKGGLGVIVSPFDDCPNGMEEHVTTSPTNKRVKICRLDRRTRKRFRNQTIPKGAKGPFRRCLELDAKGNCVRRGRPLVTTRSRS
jgi:hypothetical protein